MLRRNVSVLLVIGTVSPKEKFLDGPSCGPAARQHSEVASLSPPPPQGDLFYFILKYSQLFFSFLRKTYLPHHVPTVNVPQIHDGVHLRSPGLKLPLPGGHGGERNDEEERPVQLVLMVQVVEEGYGLDGLTEAHLVR